MNESESPEERLKELQQSLKSKGANELIKDSACVYVTGSFGRNEAGDHSDLDLFIVGENKSDGDRKFANLAEILLKAKLIESGRELKFPEFSGDGKYLVHYTIKELEDSIGRTDDDSRNTFTARLLLLLESKPLLGTATYDRAIASIVNAYWRDYQGHETDFRPTFLANDILRLWRTFCVNYEARTNTEPEEENAKRRLKNYKLKHSRLLTCFSGLIYLLGKYRISGTVSPVDAKTMASLTPKGRLDWIGELEEFQFVKQYIEDLREQYADFLKLTHEPESELIRKFMNSAERKKLFERSDQLGDLVYKIVSGMSKDCEKTFKFYRFLVV